MKKVVRISQQGKVEDLKTQDPAMPAGIEEVDATVALI